MAGDTTMAHYPYLLGLYEKSMPHELSIPQKLRETRSAGYDYMELSIDESDEKMKRLEWTSREIVEVVHAQQEEGIPIKSLCLSAHRKYPLGHPEASMRKKSLDILRRAIFLAAQLGVRIIQLAGYDVYYEQSTALTQKYFRESLQEAGLMAAKEGIILAFETMETPFMDTVGKAMHWIDILASPYVQVYPDVGNLTNACCVHGHAYSKDFARGQGHIVAVHLKETVPGRYREVPYGTGHVDFPQAVSLAWKQNVRMYVAEFWHTGESEWRSILKTNNQFLRSQFPCALVLNGISAG